jgi:Tfp pilus assembly protein PilN
MVVGSEYRMNFLRQERMGLTFRSLLVVFVVWIGVLIAIGGVQVLRTKLNTRQVVKMQQQLEQLTRDKEKRLALLQLDRQRKTGAMTQKDLFVLLRDRPLWSEAMSDLAASVPRQVRLKKVATAVEQSTDATYLEIEGVGTSVRAVTDFVMRMESAAHFKNAKLVDTDWDDQAHEFTFRMQADTAFNKDSLSRSAK